MGRLQQIAHSQARAEYLPQKTTVRNTTANAVHSLRTMQPALEQSISTARDQLRHSGLRPHDLQIALSELARRNVDVGSSTALQVGQTQREGEQSLVSLSQAQGAAQSSALASLQKAAIEHAQSVHDEIAGEHRGLATALQKKELEKQLGLLSSQNSSSSTGLTPTQQRAADQEHHNAAFYAKQLISQSKAGVKDPKTGEVTYPVPPHPALWDDTIWNAFTEKVAGKEGVSNISTAEKAVQAVRDHYQPGTGGVVDAIKTLAAPAAVATLPPAFARVAQAALQH